MFDAEAHTEDFAEDTADHVDKGREETDLWLTNNFRLRSSRNFFQVEVENQ